MSREGEKERTGVRCYEWESGDSCGTVFDVDEVFEAFREADAEGFSVRQLFELFDFPNRRYLAGTDTYDLPENPE